MKHSIALLLALVAGFEAAPVLAQPMMSNAPAGRPPFMRHLFPPRLIMRYQTEIDLSSRQRKAITGAMSTAQEKILDLRWQVEAESQKLGKLLDGDVVDEKAALEQARKVMELEQRMKIEHLGLLISIKNQLHGSQQDKLRKLRRHRGPRQTRRGNP